jgi:acyl-CoA synthetase (AMP-forming)/AMP-acid ligase II
MEWEAAKVAGVRKGNVIAFGARDPSGVDRDRERVVLAFEVQDATLADGVGRPPQSTPHDKKAADLAALAQSVRKAVLDGMGLSLDDVVPLAPGTLPKTSSGKLQRAKTRELYETGELTVRASAREKDRLELVKQATMSQLSYFKLAVLGTRKRR